MFYIARDIATSLGDFPNNYEGSCKLYNVMFNLFDNNDKFDKAITEIMFLVSSNSKCLSCRSIVMTFQVSFDGLGLIQIRKSLPRIESKRATRNRSTRFQFHHF